MKTKVELEVMIEDYKAVLGNLAERARDYRNDFEDRYLAGPGPGYEYEAGVAAGWENAVMTAQGMLVARVMSRKL